MVRCWSVPQPRNSTLGTSSSNEGETRRLPREFALFYFVERLLNNVAMSWTCLCPLETILGVWISGGYWSWSQRTLHLLCWNRDFQVGNHSLHGYCFFNLETIKLRRNGAFFVAPLVLHVVERVVTACIKSPRVCYIYAHRNTEYTQTSKIASMWTLFLPHISYQDGWNVKCWQSCKQKHALMQNYKYKPRALLCTHGVHRRTASRIREKCWCSRQHRRVCKWVNGTESIACQIFCGQRRFQFVH